VYPSGSQYSSLVLAPNPSFVLAQYYGKVQNLVKKMINITKDSNVFSNIMKISGKMINNLHKEEYKGENNMLRIQGNSGNFLRVNHTKIPITASTTNFIHSIIAGVNYNINFAGVGNTKKHHH
jgi:hypothetical protein